MISEEVKSGLQSRQTVLDTIIVSLTKKEFKIKKKGKQLENKDVVYRLSNLSN